MLKGIFLNGLKEEIQAELKLHASGSLEEIMDQALLLDEKNNAMKKVGLMNPERRSREKSTVKTTRGFTRWERGCNRESTSSKGAENEAAAQKPNVGNKLSQAELRERSKKRLCFKCGDTWSRDHVCKMKHFRIVLLEGDEGEESEEEEETEDPGVTEALTAKTMQLSLISKGGLTSHKSFKIKGTIGNTEVLVLIDCGAFNNFISRRIVKALELTVQDTPEFLVEVGNGEVVRNKGLCQQLEVKIQDILIRQHFYIMELGGTDLVLGMEWLAGLGDIRANFRNPSLKWQEEGEEKCLWGDPSLSLSQTSWKVAMKLISQEGEWFLIECHAEEAAKEDTVAWQEDLNQVLAEFESLFRDPTGLPPKRECDHAITIREGAGIPNIRPYRYPYYQKNEIEKFVKEMLSAGTYGPAAVR